ncbi:probable carboxylesterase 17 [Prosopis cineraria]|uniref:probable carboxylesterase 17 n=1 Tax=Prosopis cineraria TaxID=364024 RepID=UPI00240FA40E|nr:probable carboxylesterase 17 [Prosopis cineraria]
MAAISYRQNPHVNNTYPQKGVIAEEIQGLIRVHRDGYVERPQVVPCVSCSSSQSCRSVTSRDIFINKDTDLWARLYVPVGFSNTNKLPLLIYFHGGGFCVGSASWSCYHEFLTSLASKANCIILSPEYHLAPENRLPSAYEDGFSTVMWLEQESLNSSSGQKWWLNQTNLSSLYLAGDSAGANIAYNVGSRISSNTRLSLKGIILIQPFFGGEERTMSEKQCSDKFLTLSASDTYWRLSLPHGANRDHRYCNPLVNGVTKLRDLRVSGVLVCVSELDIMKDRNLQLSEALVRAGKKVETVMFKGVGHAFQILNNSHLSQTRTQEMISHIKNFISH